MSKINRVAVMSPVLVFCLSELATGQMRERSDVAPAYQWKLEDLYVSDQAWEQAKADVVGRLGQIAQYEGKLADPASLASCLEFDSDISKAFSRLYSYASMKSDQDTRESTCLAMRQVVEQLMTQYASTASYIEPELVKLDDETIKGFIAAEPRLKVYRMYLLDLLRRKAHKLSEKEEKILAETGLMAEGPGSVYSIFSNAEMPYPEVTLSDGTEATLNKAGYARHRSSTVRADREKVFQAFWSTFEKFKQTFGVQLYGQLQTHTFYMRTRNYDSCLHRALDRNNIPTDVYHSLIANVRDNLDSFHRYLRLKQRMLGVETLKYSDLYTPVVKDVDLEYTFD
ncbi:MAG: M3 family metallopeptidase, partial [Planctomycetota bacterium]